MDVIRHDDEFMQQIFSLVAIGREGFDQEIGSRFAPENRLAVRRDRGDEESAVGVQFEMVIRKGWFCL